MAEDSQQEKEGSKFGYLRNQYSPKRGEAEKLLKESGIESSSGEFKKARRKFARKLLESQNEGEIDPLTGILNEKGFERRFNEESERIKRFGESAILLFLDANNLKLTNDNLGHEAGDLYLKKIADSLLKVTRRVDIVARLHGDEFAAILVDTDLEKIKTVWEERMSKLFESQGISIAIGASLINPNDLNDSKKRADKAMYEAKKLSKEGVRHGEMAKNSALVAE